MHRKCVLSLVLMPTHWNARYEQLTLVYISVMLNYRTFSLRKSPTNTNIHARSTLIYNDKYKRRDELSHTANAKRHGGRHRKRKKGYIATRKDKAGYHKMKRKTCDPWATDDAAENDSNARTPCKQEKQKNAWQCGKTQKNKNEGEYCKGRKKERNSSDSGTLAQARVQMPQPSHP